MLRLLIEGIFLIKSRGDVEIRMRAVKRAAVSLFEGRETGLMRERRQKREREGEGIRKLASSTRIREGLTIRLISRACGLPLALGQGGFYPFSLFPHSFSASTCPRFPALATLPRSLSLSFSVNFESL